MGIRIGFLSLSSELITMVKSVCLELPSDVEVVIEDTNPLDMDSVFATAKQLEQSCDIIICRGGTRTEIMPQISVPVIDLPYTLADILNAFYYARDKGKHLMLILSRFSDQELGPWPEILGIKVTKVLVDYQHQIGPAVRRAKELGAVVVGGTVQVLYASSLDIESQYVLSSRETILQSLNKAIEIVRAANKEKERTARLQAILDFAYEGIIFLEGNNEIAYINSAATEILKIPREQLTGKKINEILKTSSNCLDEIIKGPVDSPLTGKLLKLDNLSIMANIVPIRVRTQTVGKIMTFFEASRLQNLEHSFRRQMARRTMTAKFNLEDIIGKSKAIEAIKQQAEIYAKTGSTVAIYGESGVGKELFAQSIHNLSARRMGPFVAINCSALPKELIESELFGYEEGAFTGARKGGKEGLFELAHGGTLFLDEIGTMPIELQSKILRVIQEREVTRLGGSNLIPVDVRIIVATNRDLNEAVRQGEFRQDLYFRLNVLPLHIPPLRERPEDIPLLVKYFIANFSRKMGWCISADDLHYIHLLQECYWPGNVRELENFCERFVAMTSRQVNNDELLKQLLQENKQDVNPSHRLNMPENGSWRDTWHVLEKNVLEKMLNESGITKTALAKSLGISRTALWKKLKERST